MSARRESINPVRASRSGRHAETWASRRTNRKERKPAGGSGPCPSIRCPRRCQMPLKKRGHLTRRGAPDGSRRIALTAARQGKRPADDRGPAYRRRDAIARDLPAKTKLTGSTED